MARKNILSGIMNEDRQTSPDDIEEKPQESFRTTTRGIGALGAVTRSIDELAARADAAQEIERRLAEGETVIKLDTALIDSSFVTDRVAMDEADFQELVEAIRARDQDTPILVRPHPTRAGHYQTVFGHRRVRVAREIGIPVRAAVKALEDRDHVLAQGQENSQRSDLSFIEKAMFAHNLETGGFGRDTIMSALGADKTTISKMLSAIKRFPADVLETVKAARAPGRDRWYSLGGWKASVTPRKQEKNSACSRTAWLCSTRAPELLSGKRAAPGRAVRCIHGPLPTTLSGNYLCRSVGQ